MVYYATFFDYLFGSLMIYLGGSAIFVGVLFIFFLFFEVFYFFRILTNFDDTFADEDDRWSERKPAVASMAEVSSYLDWSADQVKEFYNDGLAAFQALGTFYIVFWGMIYWGTPETLLIYFVSVPLVYLFLAGKLDSKSYRRLYAARLGRFDPKPGVTFFPYGMKEDISAFQILEDCRLGYQETLTSYYPTVQKTKFLLGGRINRYSVDFSSDPYSLSKFLYYYTDLYIYNAVHQYWSSCIALPFPERPWWNATERPSVTDIMVPSFYPRQYFQPDAVAPNCTIKYINSNSSLLTAHRVLEHELRLRILEAKMSLNLLSDLRFNVEIQTDPFNYAFAWHRLEDTDKFNTLIANTALTNSRLSTVIRFMFAEYVGRIDYTSMSESFHSRLRHIFFNTFSPVYYVRWLSMFLSFNFPNNFLTFYGKSFLLPADWFTWSSIYYFERWAGRTKLGLMLSRFATPYEDFNTLHTLKRGRFEFALDATLYPINRFKNYYYFDGAALFPLHRSFNFVNRLLGLSLLRPIRLILDYRRERRADRSRRITLWDYDAVPVAETWSGGDGLEPFLDINRLLISNHLGFIEDLQLCDRTVTADLSFVAQRPLNVDNVLELQCLLLDRYRFNLASFPSLFLALELDLDLSPLGMVVSETQTWSNYIHHIFYRAQSSDFYAWFRRTYSDDAFFPFYELLLDAFLKSKRAQSALLSASRMVFDDAASPVNLGFAEAPVLKYNSAFFSFEPANFAASLPRPLTRLGMVHGYRIFKPSGSRFRKGMVSAAPRFRFLGSKFSLWASLRCWLGSSQFLYDRKVRLLIRTTFRDPLIFWKSGSRGLNFRRIIWDYAFRKPLMAYMSRTFSSFGRSNLDSLCSFLIEPLFLRLKDRFGVSREYFRFILSNLSFVDSYMFNLVDSRICGLSDYASWQTLGLDPFNVTRWVKFFEFLMKDDRFLVHVISCARNPVAYQLQAPGDFLGILKTLFDFRNKVLLKVPTNYVNLMLSRGEAVGGMFGRWDWKRFVVSVSSWVSTLFGSALTKSVSGGLPVLAICSLLNGYSKFAIPFYRAISFFSFDSEKQVRNQDLFSSRFDGYPTSFMDYGYPFELENWYYRAPSDTSYKIISRVFSEYSDQLSPVSSSVSKSESVFSFMQFLRKRWELTDRFNFLISFPGLMRCGTSSVSRFEALRGCDFSTFERVLSSFLGEYRFLVCDRFPRDVKLDYDSFYAPRGNELASYLGSYEAQEGSLDDRWLFWTDRGIQNNGVMDPMESVEDESEEHELLYVATGGDGLIAPGSMLERRFESWGYALFMPRPTLYNERVAFDVFSNGREHLFLGGGDVRIMVRFLGVPFLMYFVFFLYKRYKNGMFRLLRRLNIAFKGGRLDPLDLCVPGAIV